MSGPIDPFLTAPTTRRAAAGKMVLSEFEDELLRLLLGGATNKAAAAQLGVGLRTVERRRAEALRRIGAETLVEAARHPRFAAAWPQTPGIAPGAPAGTGVIGEAWAGAACGLIVVDTTGRFLAANDAFCRLLGRGPADLLALDLISVTYPDDRARDAARNWAFFAGEFATFQAEKRYVRPEGAAVVVHLVGALISHSEGRPVRAMGTVAPLEHRRTYPPL